MSAKDVKEACDVFGEWCSDRVRDVGAKEGRKVVWDTSQRASSVLLRNLDFIGSAVGPLIFGVRSNVIKIVLWDD